MAKIIAIANQKGGTGKTATARELGAILAAGGERVLLVDLDPQGSLTAACGLIPSDLAGRSLADVLGGAQAGPLTMADILHDLGGGLWLAPAEIALADSELGLTARMGRELTLRRALATVGARFDLMILDCPPSLGLLTICGLVAADGVLIPTQPQAQDLRGVVLFLNTIKRVQDALNPALELVGVVVTFYDGRLTHHRQALETIEAAGLPVLGTVGRSVRMAEAAGAGQALGQFAPGNPQNENYKQLAEKVLQWANTKTPG